MVLHSRSLSTSLCHLGAVLASHRPGWRRMLIRALREVRLAPALCLAPGSGLDHETSSLTSPPSVYAECSGCPLESPVPRIATYLACCLDIAILAGKNAGG